MKSTTQDVTLSINLFIADLQEDLFSNNIMNTVDQTMEEGAQNVSLESGSIGTPVLPEGTTNEFHVPPSSLPMNLLDDIMADIGNDDDIFQPILGDNTWIDFLFQLDDDQLLPFNHDILGEEDQPQVMRDIAAEPERTLSPVVPTTTIDGMNVPATNISLPMNVQDIIIEENDDDDDIFLSLLGEDTNFNELFRLLEDQPIPEDALGQENPQVHKDIATSVNGVTNATTLTIEIIPNSSQNLNNSIIAELLPQRTNSDGEGSSQRPIAQDLGGYLGNMGVVNPIPTLENLSNPSLPLTQNNSNSWSAGPSSWYHPSAMNKSTPTLGTTDPNDPQRFCFSFGSSTLFTTMGNSITPIQQCPPPSSPLFPYSGNSNGSQQNVTITTGTNPRVSPMLMSPRNHSLGQNQLMSPFKESTFELGEESSRGNMGVVNPNPSSQTFSNSSLSLPRNNQNSQYNPIDSSNNGHQQQFQRHLDQFEMNGNNSVGTHSNAMGPNSWIPLQYNQRPNKPQQPTLDEFSNFVEAWQGSLAVKIHSNRSSSLYQAMAYRRPTTPATLTVNWSKSLGITLFLPKQALNYTTRICGGPIDYMFFHLTHFNNLHFYSHLASKNLCAKIDLSSHTIILSTTESKHHFIGSIFPRDTVFIEPVYLNFGLQGYL